MQMHETCTNLYVRVQRYFNIPKIYKKVSCFTGMDATGRLPLLFEHPRTAFILKTYKDFFRQPHLSAKFTNLFQVEGEMQKDSLAHEEYTRKQGERYEAKRPLDSDFLRGDGLFTAKTQKETDYVPKKGERYKAVKPMDSDVLKVCFWKFEVSLLRFLGPKGLFYDKNIVE